MDLIERTDGERPGIRLHHNLTRLLTWFPWGWLLALMFFWAGTAVPHFRAGAGMLRLIYWPLYLLTGPVMLAPLLWMVTGLASHFTGMPYRLDRRGVFVFISGWLLVALILLNDWNGLFTRLLHPPL